MKDKLNQMLDQKPPTKGKPLGLSTEAPTDIQSEITQSHNRTIAPTQQLKTSAPKRTKRGYAFREDLVKACKQIALDSDRLLYEVMEEALTKYLEGEGPRIAALEGEVAALKVRLNLEEKFRTDTEVRHFKSWIRSHSQPQDATDFFQRFQQDTRLPQHASRSLYEARLRANGYTDEEIALFEGAWRDMLATEAQ